MENNFSVEENIKKREKIESRIEFIKSTIVWATILLFLVFGLSRFNIIPGINIYAAIYTFLTVIAVSVVTFAFEQIKLFEYEEDDDEEDKEDEE